MLFRRRVNVTCTASAASYQEWVESAYFVGMRYTTATASMFATGATVYLTASPLATGPSLDILKFTGTSAGQFVAPRAKTQTTAGATGGDLLQVQIPLAKEYLKLTVEGGGASGVGIFDFYFDGH